MPAEIQYTTRPSALEDIRAAQHQNFTAPAYGELPNSMDAVDRGSFPETPVLESQFNGQGVPFHAAERR